MIRHRESSGALTAVTNGATRLRMIGAQLKDDAARIGAKRRSMIDICRLIVTNPPLRCAAIYRLSTVTPGPMGRILQSVNITLHGADIDPRAKIGPGLLLQHPVGVVIGGGVVIGSTCTIMSSVVLGRREVSAKHAPGAYPTIGDGVLLGTSSILLGAIKVGDASAVGAQSLVLQDVPAHTTVVGSPARIVGADATK